jgi:uncharacterized protein
MASSLTSSKTNIHDQDQVFVVTATAESATMAIKSSIEMSGKLVTCEEAISKLKSLGINHGLDIPRIEAQIQNKEYNVPIPVARWTPPEDGQDARLDQIVKLLQDGKPQINQDGTADFRNIDNIVQVTEGQVIAQKRPATMGKPGKDIFGNLVSQNFGKDVALPAGANTEIVEDGTKVIAKKSGYLFRKHGVLCVGETYEVTGGVNYKSGNVRFSGDVVIHGTVADGFTVEAGGKLVIEGDVEGAELIAGKGGITVTGGIFGKEKALLKTTGQVHVNLVQQCRIECQSLAVSKSLIHCTVKTWNVDATTPGCLVHGGSITCYGDVSLYEAGHEGDRTEIIMLNEEEEELRANFAKLMQEEEKIKPEIETCEKRLKQIKTMADKMGAAIPPKVAQEVKTLIGAFTEYKKKLHHIGVEKTMVQDLMKSPSTKRGIFRIIDRPQWGVHLNMFHFEKKLSPEDGKKEFRLVDSQLMGFTLASET